MSRIRVVGIVCLLILWNYSALYSQDKFIQRSGDVLAAALPSIVLVPDAWDYLQDGDLRIFRPGFAYGISMGITYILKFSVNKTRPNSDPYSFPSGHSTSAFSGATLIQLRYGWRWGLPAYILASYVAYSRVHSQKHYTTDVLTGAVIGTGVSFLVYHYWPKKWQNLSFRADSRTIGFVYSL